ncbi:hypothetical protein [Paludisphaera mucosa]|uniref:DUF2007 domain-containing protein n=1 Tax=Paludisphaera mucosa TaxID=3030827 RepID=A0ABT6F910_9BACT|nr:hypothetical protein [Paludisphaera mucosa]MDG3004034.1 hypothetical protein [Paludisphaera mucosa]
MRTTPTRIPGYCPTCRRTVAKADPSKLCAHCGDRIVPQGYCPVCEGFQLGGDGAVCRKHDVPLEAAPPTSSGVDAAGPWVEVAHYPDAMDCQPLRIRLEAEGIPTTIDGERMGSRSMYAIATGGVVLRVPQSLAGDARVILSQTWSKDSAELGIEDDDWDDLDDDGLGASEQDDRSWRGLSLKIVAAGLLIEAVYFVYATVKFFLRVGEG